ncbi:hypothetical protein FRC07_001381, partial [Ceratobasidium sp. 392]
MTDRTKGTENTVSFPSGRSRTPQPPTAQPTATSPPTSAIHSNLAAPTRSSRDTSFRATETQDQPPTPPGPSNAARGAKWTAWAGLRKLTDVMSKGAGTFGPMKLAIDDMAQIVDVFESWIWDANTGAMVRESLESHIGLVLSVSYSPCSRYIVSGSSDGTICVWGASTSQMIGQPLEGHTDSVSSVLYSSDGDYIASGSHDGTVRIWNAPAGHLVCRPFSSPGSWVKCIAFSPDGTDIAAGYGNGEIRVWHIHTRERVSVWAGSAFLSQPEVIEPCLCHGWSYWELDKDGWIVNEHAERLIWVPQDL